MNINKQKTVLGAALFFLMIGLVQFLLAAANVEESTEQERVAVLQANVPRTPEQLLQVFKDLLANPDVDGQEFCENRLGIGRESWTNSPPSGDLEKRYFDFRSKKLPNFPLVPLQFVSISLNRQKKIYQIKVNLYRNPNLNITPTLARQILGAPEWIGVSQPNVITNTEMPGSGGTIGSYTSYRYSEDSPGLVSFVLSIFIKKLQKILCDILEYGRCKWP